MNLGFISVPSIVAICYLVGFFIKTSPIDSKWIPLVCGTAGAFLGGIAFFFAPGTVEGDILSAIAVGIASGFASTGIHQAGGLLKE